jgi:hypothetical protein
MVSRGGQLCISGSGFLLEGVVSFLARNALHLVAFAPAVNPLKEKAVAGEEVGVGLFSGENALHIGTLCLRYTPTRPKRPRWKGKSILNV